MLAAAAGNNLKSGAVLGQDHGERQAHRCSRRPRPTARKPPPRSFAGTPTPAPPTGAPVLIDRDAEVIDTLLIWPAGITDPQKAAALGQLAALGIKLRQGDPL